MSTHIGDFCARNVGSHLALKVLWKEMVKMHVTKTHENLMVTKEWVPNLMVGAGTWYSWKMMPKFIVVTDMRTLYKKEIASKYIYSVKKI